MVDIMIKAGNDGLEKHSYFSRICLKCGVMLGEKKD